MKIFEPIVTKDYEWINAVNEKDYEKFTNINDGFLNNNWKPIEVKLIKSDGKKKFKRSDFPWLGSDTLIIRENVIGFMTKILGSSNLILPLNSSEGDKLFVINAPIVDCLDEDNSTIKRFFGSEKIMRITKYSFISNRIGDRKIFRLPFRSSPTFVSEEFINLYKQDGLLGLTFNKVWEG